MQNVIKILFLAANPPGTARLDLDQEVSKIEDGLQRSRLKDRFQLVSKWAVDSNALRRALLEETPDIVHFSGHGEGEMGLVLVGQDGKAKPATGEALSGLFQQFPTIKCVLLNACYAEVQAKAIVQHVDYVIGMRQAVRDDAAISFATGFYDGLGYDKSIDTAFALGCNAVQFELASFSKTLRSRKLIPVDLAQTEPLPDHLVPILLKREAGLTGKLSSSSTQMPPLSTQLRTQQTIAEADALKIYRQRVREFIGDLRLTQIEKFQLAILANVLGISESDANRILQEEQNQQPASQPSTPRSRPLHQKYLIAGAAFLAIVGGGFMYHQTATPYAQLRGLLEEQDWRAADEETARILWKLADRQKERALREEDFEKISCADLRHIDELWQKNSTNHFGFGVQKRIWQSEAINGDLTKFSTRVGWGFLSDGKFAFQIMGEKPFDLSDPPGKLPWTTTYVGGNSETRKSYMSRLIRCLP